jgi:hypothetical protein
MKLRIARKMDIGNWKRRKHDDRDKRSWWQVYTDDQLRRAMDRLRRSWHTRCPPIHIEEGKSVRALVPDFFALNRVESRLVRQRAIRQAIKARPR